MSSDSNIESSAARDPLWWANPELKHRLETDAAAVLRDRGINIPAEIPHAVVHEFVRVTHLLWVEGRITPIDRFYIDPADEGLLFGRGVWESTRTVNGEPWLWSLHIDRLRRTSQLLNMEVPLARLPDNKQVAEFVLGLTKQDVVIRLNASAGRPGKPGLVWMSAAPIPYYPASVRLQTSTNPVQKGQAYLTLKTFQYATRLRMGQQATQGGFDTALVVDTEGNLQEAAHANLFVRFADGWATPKADGGLLPGTVRQVLIEKSPLPIQEMVIPRSRIGEIREAFVTNSNIGIVPVTKIDSHEFAIGAETQKLMRWLGPKQGTGPQYRFVDRGLTPR